MERTIVVGDVHGCLDELRRLLVEVGHVAGEPLISVGDLVGKGPDGAGVVRFFREGRHRAVCGNHDVKLLEARRGEREGLRASHAAHAAALSEADWAWLEALPLSLAIPEHQAIVVHGGLVPGVALEAQDPRLMMNLRSIRADGTPSTRVDDGEPWASTWPGPELVVFGHDAIRGLQQWPHAIGLDTGCVYGGALSALVFPERSIVSVPAARCYAAAETPMSGRVRACRRDALGPGDVHVAPLSRDESGRPREALILVDDEGEVRAYLNRCEHLPIPLDAGSREFLDGEGRHLMCGTHGALFRREDGFCIEGPCAGESLLALPFRITDDGWVELID